MVKKTEILQVRIDSDMKGWLNTLSNKYRVKKGEFIRRAIIEKMQRDVPGIRLKHEYEKNKTPFD